MPSMFDDMYIPWTPRLGLKKKTPPSQSKPEPESTASAATPAELCVRTLHVAKTIISHAVQPFPEVARAIAMAFIAFHRGELQIDGNEPVPASGVT